jgi:hypothetical protein
MRSLAALALLAVAALTDRAGAQVPGPSATGRAIADSIAVVLSESAPSPADVIQRMTAPTAAAASERQAKLMKAMGEFMGKHFPKDSVRAVTRDFYADAFTEAELRALLVFYRSDVGRKAQRTAPDLMMRLQERYGAIMMRHQGELQAIMMQSMQSP